MFITFVERFSSSGPDKQPSANITKLFYKLNRQGQKISRADLKRTAAISQSTGRSFAVKEAPTVTNQIEIVKNELSSSWISEDQIKAIRAILLFIETMPYKAEKDCNDDAYLTLLLPHLDEIISNTYLRSKDFKERLCVPFETLKKMFMVRLSLGFGIWSEKDISARDLSLLARQNNLKSIQNAVSKKELYALKGKGSSQRIDAQSARNWLTKKIKNRLIYFSWSKDGPALNSRSELHYLNYFKVKYFQILCFADLEQLEDCPDRGCYQLIDRGIESTRKIYYGHSKNNLANRFKLNFRKGFTEATSNINNDNYSGPKFHLLVFEPKRDGKNGDADFLNLESLFERTAEPLKDIRFKLPLINA